MSITKVSSHAALAGLALLLAPAATLTAHATEGAAPAASTSNAVVPPSVLALDQKADGSTVTIKYAQLPRAGYIAIYNTDALGKITGDPIGHVALKAGDHRDVKVQLTKAPGASQMLRASLYEDKDGDSKLDKSKDVSFWANQNPPSGGLFRIQ